MNMTLTD